MVDSEDEDLFPNHPETKTDETARRKDNSWRSFVDL